MEKYGFNLEQIREKRDKLRFLLFNNVLTIEERETISSSIDACESILKNFEEDEELSLDDLSKSELLDEVKEFVTEDDYNDESKFVRDNVCSLLSKLICKKDSSFSFTELNLTNEEAVELVGDMIKSKLGMNHYNIFKNLFIKQKDHIEFSDIFSSSLIFVPSTKEAYSIIHNHSDIAKASDLAHEAGHYFSSTVSKSIMLDYSVLDEVESIFYELLFIDFLIEENINRDDAKALFSELITSSIQRAYILDMEFNYPMYKLNSIRDFKVMANKYDLYNITEIFNSKDLLNWINIYNNENPFMYVYSFLIALEFYEQYKSNRNKKAVVSKYEKFISQIGMIPDFRLASCVSRDYIGFEGYKTLRKYKTKYVK